MKKNKSLAMIHSAEQFALPFAALPADTRVKHVEAFNVRETFVMKDGKPVLTPGGEKITAALTIAPKPRKSEDHPDMVDASGGLTGQSLLIFEREANDAMMKQMFEEFMADFKSGNMTFGKFTRNLRTGRKTYVVKPAHGVKTATQLTNDDIIALAKSRGLNIIANAPEPTPEAKAEAEAKLSPKQKAKLEAELRKLAEAKAGQK